MNGCDVEFVEHGKIEFFVCAPGNEMCFFRKASDCRDGCLGNGGGGVVDEADAVPECHQLMTMSQTVCSNEH